MCTKGENQTVPLSVLLKRKLASEKIEKPEIFYGQASQSKKGEDFTLLKTECQRVVGDGISTYSVFALFDGHNGSAAAIYAKENLLNNVLSAIPLDLNRDEWIAALPRALVAGFVKTDKDFQQKDASGGVYGTNEQMIYYAFLYQMPVIPFQNKKLMLWTLSYSINHLHLSSKSASEHEHETAQTSGTTVTFVIIEGWFITVASVGDSRCILEAEGEIYYLSADHRLESNEEERMRITSSGGEVGRLNTGGGAEIGPLRCWPGGLCLSRSIGDVDVGEFIVPVPHVKQVKLSTAGGRLIVSSDGVWDALLAETALDCCRNMPADAAAAQIVKESVQAKGLRDDTTCIVIDILPQEKQAAPLPPPKKPGKKVFKSMFRKKPPESSSSVDKEEYPEPDVVEELYEEGSAMLSERLETKYPLCNMFKLFMCAVCQLEMRPGEGISIHAGESNTGKLRPWDGPFLCSTCQEKKEAMEGKKASDRHSSASDE